MKNTMVYTLVIVGVLLCIPVFNGIGDVSEVRPLVAYSVRTIPIIDGIASVGEWNDTVIYEYIRNNTEILDAPIKLQCALKHDDNWLYILFIVNVVVSDCEVTILTLPESDISLRTESAYVVLPNGTVKNARLDKTGIVPNWTTTPNAEASSTFLVNEFVVEIKLDKSLFNITYNYSPFNIEYTHVCYGSNTIAVGDIRHTVPGLIFSSRYYNVGNEDIKQDSLYWLPVLLILIAIPIGIVYILHRKRKTTARSQEPKPEHPEGEKGELH